MDKIFHMGGVNISDTSSKTLRRVVANLMKEHPAYVLDECNCSTWAGQVVTSIYLDVASLKILAPLALINNNDMVK